MKLVRWRNNPNKKNLIYIPLPHVTVICVYTTWFAKRSDKTLTSYYISILLLFLVWPIYLGMCTSIPVYIHSYMSKSRLVIENQRGYQRAIFTVGLVHARDHGPGYSVAGLRNRPRGVNEKGLIICPFRTVTGGRVPPYPSEHPDASGRTGSFSYTTYLIPL